MFGRGAVRTSDTRDRFVRAANAIRAKYDAAASTDENTRHWLNADSLSAKSANSAHIRQILRDRSRYEWSNNCYCQGMTRTAANEVIGTGPRLQMLTESEEFNREMELRVAEWMDATDLVSKLRIADESEYVLGEMFGVFTYNPALPCDVQLDIRLVEPDQFTTPFPNFTDPTAVDGIRFDQWGNPKEYDMLRYHPGGEGEFGFMPWNLTPNVLQAANVIHWMTPTRAGQARGIPAITPALPLFAQLRRYTLAVLQAAEIAACFAAVIKTTSPNGSGLPAEDDSGFEAFDTADIVRGMFQMLPDGTEMQQFRPEQPVTGYGEFVDRILKEACRSMEMPYGTATGDSSQYNYSSGRLDVQAWVRKVQIRRRSHERHLNRIINEWADEATKIKGYLPIVPGSPRTWKRLWYWDPFGHVDPQKEASATDTNLRNLSKTLTQVLAAEGRDRTEHFDELQREIEECKARGLIHPSQAPAPTSPLGKSGMEQPPLNEEPLPEEQQPEEEVQHADA